MSSIVKVSEAATLAMHTMAFLAANPGERFSVKHIAGIHDVSEAHLSKVLQRLAKIGLLNSARGPKGGFVLARAAEEITLLNVYEAVDGPLDPTTCLLGSPVCNGRGCIMGDVLKTVNEQTKTYLTQTTIVDVASSYCGEDDDD